MLIYNSNDVSSVKRFYYPHLQVLAWTHDWCSGLKFCELHSRLTVHWPCTARNIPQPFWDSDCLTEMGLMMASNGPLDKVVGMMNVLASR